MDNGDIDDTEQHSYFNPTFQLLLYIIVFSTIMGFLASVFNFYSFDYSQYYSIIFFYLFLITCTFVLPVRMIGVDPPNYTNTISQAAIMLTRKLKEPPPTSPLPVPSAPPLTSSPRTSSPPVPSAPPPPKGSGQSHKRSRYDPSDYIYTVGDSPDISGLSDISDLASMTSG